MPARKPYRRQASGDKPDVYQSITDRIIASIEAGNLPPWRKPWSGRAGFPKNAVSKERYSGINPWLLQLTAIERGYTSPWWVTFKQAIDLGGNVMAGQNSASGCGQTEVIRYGTFEKDEIDPETGEPKRGAFLKRYGVFNAQQCEGLPEWCYPQPEAEILPEDEPERVFSAYFAQPGTAAVINDRHTGAFYDPAKDEIHLPAIADHVSAARYYSTLAHETGHSTGHKSRLDRDGMHDVTKTFGCEEYSREELVAEFAAAIMCAETGVANTGTTEQSATYISGWAGKLKDEPKLLVQAASAGGKAADMILSPSRQATPVAEPEAAPVRSEAEDLKIMRAAIARTAGRAPDGQHEAA